MDCDHVREDIEAYALGALDRASARRLQAHLRVCTACREPARAYGAVADQLALSAPLVKAPPRLKERVLGGIGVFRPNVTPVTLVRTSRWWAAAAAVFLAFAVGSIVWAFTLSHQVNNLKADNARLAELTQLDAEQRAALLKLQSELNLAKSQQRQMETTLQDQAILIVLALDPDLIPTELQGTSIAPEAHCRYVWSTKQSLGALTCQRLSAINFMLTYQLWAVRGEKVTSMGIFMPRPDGSAHLLYKPTGEGEGPITNMFVTLEAASQLARQPSLEVVLEKAPPQQASR